MYTSDVCFFPPTKYTQITGTEELIFSSDDSVVPLQRCVMLRSNLETVAKENQKQTEMPLPFKV